MEASQPKLTVLQAKFAAYLSWSQPFLHALVAGLDPHVRNVVLCEHTENLDRFPVRHVERIPTRYLVRPGLAVLAAGYLQRTWQPDLMHAHFGWSGLRLLMLKQILRIPLVVTFGGRDVGLQMQLADFRELYAMLLDASDAIVCVSHDLRAKLVAAGVDPDRVHVIHRGTDLGRFGFVDRRARDADAPVRLLMVGRIVEKKGHRDALEALAPLVASGRAVELVVVGEGEGYHALRRLRRRLGLRAHVELAGSTDHAGVRRHMERADLLLHCSVTPPSGDVEGIPNVVVEAQAMGLPVVGTRHGGIAEAVRDGETGLLVPEGDVASLRAALERLVDDRALRLRMGRRAREFVDAHFSLDRQVAQHLAVYEKVVAHAASDPGWRSRAWLPPRYPELAARALLAHGISHPAEFSIAELAERLVGERRLERLAAEGRADAADLVGAAYVPAAARIAAGAAGGPEAPADARRESRLERLYGLKALLPQSVKFPLKLALGRALAWAIERRHRRHGRGDALAARDARVFAFFRSGGSLRAWEERAAAEAGRSGDAKGSRAAS